jgi:hypothetical protein
LYLRNDDNSGWISGTVGDTSNLRNSQVRIPLDKVTIQEVGFEVIIKAPMFFYSGFNGAHNLYLRSWDQSNTDTDWEASGTYTVNSVNAAPNMVENSDSSDQ